MFNPEDRENMSTGRNNQGLKELISLRKRSEAIVFLAKKKAQAILEKAEEKGKVVEKEAYQKGYERGYREGLEAGTSRGIQQVTQDGRKMMEEMENHVAQYEESMDILMEGLEKKILELTLETVKKVINREIEEDDEFILRNIRSAAESITGRDTARLMVHKDDMEKVLEHKLDLISGIDAISDMEVIRGNKVDKGGCMVEAPSGIVDARIESQLEAIGDIYESV